MGFDVNFNNNKPVITGAQAMQDGGAGNLGYFEQEREKKEKEKSVFAETKKETEDAFVKEGEEILSEEKFSITTFIAKAILTLKDFLKKIFKI